MKFTISTNTQQLMRVMVETQRNRVPFGVVWAMTKSGQVAKERVRMEMQTTIDRPRAWTLNSLQLKPANKDRPFIELGYKEFGTKVGTPAGKYLRTLESGGQRRHKKFEKALIANRLMLPTQFAVPARGFPLDKEGNVSQEVIVRILSHLRAFAEGGYNANLSRDKDKRRRRIASAGEQFFASTGAGRGALPPGIYRRDAFTGKIQMAFAFVKAPTYRRQFRFYDVAREAFLYAFPKWLAEGLQRYKPRL